MVLTIHLAGLLLFCMGFFPSKVVLPGYGQFSSDDAFDPQFNKVIVMVVDALRSDFVFSDRSSMEFVQGLLRKGSAIGYTAFSNPPTVTLPRLKGITTGSTPNFLDAVLNVVEDDTSSTLANQDSWLKQLKIGNKKIHMFGDDTWIKLFPGEFDVSEGTSSFFVSDFTEVDNNVTRHLDQELNEQKWDCLILHYLGLDHIGHKGGPESTFMRPKQKEMDEIVKLIYDAMEEDTLFVLLGDHGMNEIGNHGGSSAGETSAALVFIADKLQELNKTSQSPLRYNDEFTYYERIQQIDLVPTLCSLLRLPIPKNSLGVFIRDFLSLWPEDQRKFVLKENLLHYDDFKKNDFPGDPSESETYEWLYEAQSELTRSASNYNMPLIYSGVAAIAAATILTLWRCFKLFKNQAIIMISMTFIYSVTAFGSSLVEEEHQIWWWFATFFVVIFSYDQPVVSAFSLLLLRLIRGWNNSGQKFVGDTVYRYLDENYHLNWILIAITISSISFSLNQGGFSKTYPVVGFISTFTTSLCLFSFKLMYSVINGDQIPKQLNRLVEFSLDLTNVENEHEALVEVAKLFFTCVIGLISIRLFLRFFAGNNYWFYTDLHNILTLVLIFQTSIPNIGLFLVLFSLKNVVGYIVGTFVDYDNAKVIGYTSIALVILQNLTFFSFGQTNSLNTVDLSNAYNGIKSYNIFAVGLLTFLSNFAGPIYWEFASLPIFLENSLEYKVSKGELFSIRWSTNALFYCLSTFFTVISCVVQRYHLFIWTVFSPKVLYTLVWNLFINFAVEIIILFVALII